MGIINNNKNMTVALFYKKETDTRAKITTIHYQPHLLSEEKRKKTIEVNEMPKKPETKNNEKAKPYVNPKTKEVWYEVVEKELSEEQKEIQELKEMIKKIEGKIK